MKKKIIAILLSLTLMCGILPIVSFAQEPYDTADDIFAAAAAYEYPAENPYTYSGFFASSGDFLRYRWNSDILASFADHDAAESAFYSDIDRFFGAVYYFDNGASAQSLTFNDIVYTWDASLSLPGSNWKNEEGKLLIDAIREVYGESNDVSFGIDINSDYATVDFGVLDNDCVFGNTLIIAGKKVTSKNARDVLGFADFGASVKFDFDENTLYLNNARISAANTPAIAGDLADLNIVVEGKCSIITEKTDSFDAASDYKPRGIFNYGSINISGSGSLYIESADEGMATLDGDINIQDITLDLTSKADGFAPDTCGSDWMGNLYIIGSDVSVYSEGDGIDMNKSLFPGTENISRSTGVSIYECPSVYIAAKEIAVNNETGSLVLSSCEKAEFFSSGDSAIDCFGFASLFCEDVDITAGIGYFTTALLSRGNVILMDSPDVSVCSGEGAAIYTDSLFLYGSSLFASGLPNAICIDGVCEDPETYLPVMHLSEDSRLMARGAEAALVIINPDDYYCDPESGFTGTCVSPYDEYKEAVYDPANKYMYMSPDLCYGTYCVEGVPATTLLFGERCIYKEYTDFAGSGTYGIEIGGRDAGSYALSSNEAGGIAIADENGKYYGIEKGRIALSDTPFFWEYKDGKLSAVVANKTTVFSGFFFFGFSYKTVTKNTAFYLTCGKQGLNISEYAKENVKFYNEAESELGHKFTYTPCEDGTHIAVCENCGKKIEDQPCCYSAPDHSCACGALDPLHIIPQLHVKAETVKTGGYGLFWFRAPSKTTYKYTFTAERIKAESFEISLDNENFTYCNGSFTSDSPIEKLYIRVTSKAGGLYSFAYDPSISETEGYFLLADIWGEDLRIAYMYLIDFQKAAKQALRGQFIIMLEPRSSDREMSTTLPYAWQGIGGVPFYHMATVVSPEPSEDQWFERAFRVAAGGIATSGLEMSQNSQRLSWTFEDVDAKLCERMLSAIGVPVKYIGTRTGMVAEYDIGLIKPGLSGIVTGYILQAYFDGSAYAITARIPAYRSLIAGGALFMDYDADIANNIKPAEPDIVRSQDEWKTVFYHKAYMIVGIPLKD